MTPLEAYEMGWKRGAVAGLNAVRLFAPMQLDVIEANIQEQREVDWQWIRWEEAEPVT